MEFLYDDGEYYYFMNTETFEQMHLMKDLLGDATNFLIPQLKVNVEFYEGKAVSVELPPSVDMKVVSTEPGLKGATVSNVTKPAKLETGLVVQVPRVHQRRRKDSRVDGGIDLPRALVTLPLELLLPPRNTVRKSNTRRSFSIRRDDRRIVRSRVCVRARSRCRIARAATLATTDRESIRRRPRFAPRSAPALNLRANVFRSRANFVGGHADHADRGDFFPTLENQMAQRGLQRLRDQLVDPQRAEQRIAPQARRPVPHRR